MTVQFNETFEGQVKGAFGLLSRQSEDHLLLTLGVQPIPHVHHHPLQKGTSCHQLPKPPPRTHFLLNLIDHHHFIAGHRQQLV